MANGHGGRRAGAGRRPGGMTQRTQQLVEEVRAQGISPLEYMLAVLRDETVDPERRDEMAKAAAPYIHPRLSSVEAKVAVTGHEAALAELE
jgi:hypothetical protein